MPKFNYMKKLFLLSVLICSVMSCDVGGDDSLNYYYETLPIESVNMPDEFTFGYTYEIEMTYLRPTDCHQFNDFYYLSDESQRTIAIITTVFTDLTCTPFDYELEEVSFNFQVNSHDSYTFRFWLGEDDNGNDTYHVVEIPVVQ